MVASTQDIVAAPGGTLARRLMALWRLLQPQVMRHLYPPIDARAIVARLGGKR